MSVYFKIGKYDSESARERVIDTLRKVGFNRQTDTRCEWTLTGMGIGVNLNNPLDGYIQIVARTDHLSSKINSGDISHQSEEYDLLRRLASELNPSVIVNDCFVALYSDLLSAARTVKKG